MKNQKSKVNKHIASSSSKAGKPNKSSRYIPEFFKVLDDVHFSRHLSIPPDYINHIDGFPSTCVLRVPTGKMWTVRVEERNDGFFFHGGWRQFVRDNTLQIGHFLLFAYDGDSTFDVKIYSHSGCEKEEYQAPVEVDSENSEDHSEEDELDHIEDSNYEDSREDEDREDEQSEEDELAHTDEDSEEAPISIKRERDSIPSGRRPATEDGKETSTIRILFKSEHPCFVPTYRKNKYRVGIPKEVAVLGGLNGQESVTLIDPEGRSWPVQLRYDDRWLLTAGWVRCCRANKISMGDTVIFEIVDKRTMKLHIFRGEAGGKRCHVVLVCPMPNHQY